VKTHKLQMSLRYTVFRILLPSVLTRNLRVASETYTFMSLYPSPRPRTAPPEASPAFRQSLLSIARGMARSYAPRMRRRPGTFDTRELSHCRFSAAGLHIAGCPVHLSGVPCAPGAKLRPYLSTLVQRRSLRCSQLFTLPFASLS